MKTYSSHREAESAALASVEQERGHHVQIVSSTPYVDLKGWEIMRVLRFERGDGTKETFRPIYRTAGRWAIGDPPGKLPMCGLPELKDKERVYFVEGEKAYSAARSIALPATTTPHGADAADRVDWDIVKALSWREVVILRDNDTPGLRYAEAVARNLRRVRPSMIIKVVLLPGLPLHGDIVEYIEACGAEVES